MSDTPENKAEDGEILLQAAEYYLALQDNSMTSAELRAWQSWFLRSQEHQEAFRRLETLWGVLDNLSIDDFETETDQVEAVRDTDQDKSGEFSDGSILSLIASEEKQVPVAKSPMRQWGQAIAACLAVVTVAGYLMIAPGSQPEGQPTTAFETAAVDQRVVTLSDGSIMELGPDSAVDVNYQTSVRQITLVRGQAVFTVSKNPNRPFVVNAGNGSVTAIGTVFNVRKRQSEIQVRVLEGTVAVRPVSTEIYATTDAKSPAPVALVTAGSQTHYSNAGLLEDVIQADMNSGLEWRVGVLKMENRQLGDVIRELNQFVENEITIGDEAISQFSFTGTVYPERMDDWLDGLQQGYPLKVMRVGSSTVLMLDDTDEAGSPSS